MTGVQLASMSTALWIVATVSLFILLAGWSNGASWGLTASIVRGVRGWSDTEGRPSPVTVAPVAPLRPMLDPYAALRRPTDDPGTAEAAEADALVEIVDLGERHLPG
jgi:hypothetical protein